MPGTTWIMHVILSELDHSALVQSTSVNVLFIVWIAIVFISKSTVDAFRLSGQKHWQCCILPYFSPWIVKVCHKRLCCLMVRFQRRLLGFQVKNNEGSEWIFHGGLNKIGFKSMVIRWQQLFWWLLNTYKTGFIRFFKPSQHHFKRIN